MKTLCRSIDWSFILQYNYHNPMYFCENYYDFNISAFTFEKTVKCTPLTKQFPEVLQLVNKLAAVAFCRHPVHSQEC